MPVRAVARAHAGCRLEAPCVLPPSGSIGGHPWLFPREHESTFRRPVPAVAALGQGRDGRSLPRPRHGHRPGMRAQAAAARDGRRSALGRAPRVRGVDADSAPAVVAVHELGMSPEGIPFCTMEYVPGLPADEAIARDDWSALFYIAARVTHGLEALHAAHVAHGDLKPSNLLVLPGERPGMLPRSVRLVDFGLAAVIGGAGEGHVGTAGLRGSRGGEGTGAVAGERSVRVGRHALRDHRPRCAVRGRHPGCGAEKPGSGPARYRAAGSGRRPGSSQRLILGLMAREPNERPRDAREVRRELETLHPAARRPLSERVDTSSVVGRERELARLESWWAQVPVRPPITVITGAAGTGKSALLSRAGHACGPGRAAGNPSVVRIAVRTRSLSRLRSCGRLAADAGADPAPVLGAGVQESALDELSERAAQWAHALVVKAQPVVVLLDDAELLDGVVEGLDSPSRRATGALSACVGPGAPFRRRCPGGRGGPVRSRSGSQDRALAARSPTRSSGSAAVRLGEVAPQAVIHFLRERCGGHPGLVVDLLRAAARTGAIQEDEAGLRVEEEALRGLVAPESYEAALIQRLENLDSTSRRAIEALAVWAPASIASGCTRSSRETDGDTIGRLLESGLATRTDSGELLLVATAARGPNRGGSAGGAASIPASSGTRVHPG